MASPLAHLPEPVARPLRALLRRPEDPRLVAAAEALGEGPLFAGLSRRARLALADAAHVRRYARGEVLYYQGDPASGLYVVQEGVVVLSAETEEGAREELSRLSRGASFGERGVLGDFRRAETVEAVRDTTVIGLFQSDLRGLIKRDRRVGVMVAVSVAQRIAAREEALIQVLREGHVPAHRLLHRLPLDQPADPSVLVG